MIETKIKFSNRPKVCVINPGILGSMSMGIYLLLELRIAGFYILFYISLSWKLLLENKSVFGLCAISLQNNTTSSGYIFAQFSKVLLVLLSRTHVIICLLVVWLQMILYDSGFVKYYVIHMMTWFPKTSEKTLHLLNARARTVACCLFVDS